MSHEDNFDGRYDPVLSTDGRWVLFGDSNSYARAHIECVCIRSWKSSGRPWSHVSIKMLSGERINGRPTHYYEARRQFWMIMGTTPAAPASTSTPTTAASAAAAASP